jgi:hypothetical protein
VVIVAMVIGCSAEPEWVQSNPRWQDAKATAQAAELEIAGLIPADEVVSIDQHETGSLFSCDEKRHRWTGITYVTLVPGAKIEAVVKQMEKGLGALFAEGDDFKISNYRDMFDEYTVEAESPIRGESYLFVQDDSATISIDSWSECFTLPEGTYPGGSF